MAAAPNFESGDGDIAPVPDVDRPQHGNQPEFAPGRAHLLKALGGRVQAEINPDTRLA
jgi:hypothetical protein